MASNPSNLDLDQYFDFDLATWTDAGEDETAMLSHIADEEDPALASLALQNEAPNLCADQTPNFDPFNLFSDQLPIPQDASQAPFADEGDFSQWIASYHLAPEPCAYCSSKQLECNDGWSGCNACLALFRECSLTKSHAPIKDISRYFRSVPESSAQDTAGLTGCRDLISLTGSMDTGSASLKATTRFPRAAVKILKDWLSQHSDHPYPTDAERYCLKQETGLTHTQILHWLANVRRRGKVLRRAASPALGMPSKTPPIGIPVNTTRSHDPALRGLTPMDRFKASAPEYEAAFMSDITDAVAKSGLIQDLGEPSTSSKQSLLDLRGVSPRSCKRTPSVSSLESSRSSTSFSTARSHGSRNSLRSLDSFTKKDRRRRRQPTPAITCKDSSDTDRLFQCTFCADTFKSKYDWTRHEKSLHLSLEKWICSPLGPVQTCYQTGMQRCVFCNAPTVDVDIRAHAETHNYSICKERLSEKRGFLRKDHLRQHLRLVHDCEMHYKMDRWRLQLTTINSRCGFCTVTFTTWDDRADHLSKHFRSGARMKDWKGDWGFDASIAAQVSNALPYPFLIGTEASSSYPFHATDPASMRCDHPWEENHLPPMGDNTCRLGTANDTAGVVNCWQALGIPLGHYVTEQLDGFVVPTDEMLQRQVRLISNGDGDCWNQTAANDQEWLALFKQNYGLGESKEPGSTDKGNVNVDNDSSRSRGHGPAEVTDADEAMIGEMNFDDFLLHDMEDLEIDNAN